jgi:hypothetical protein
MPEPGGESTAARDLDLHVTPLVHWPDAAHVNLVSSG